MIPVDRYVDIGIALHIREWAGADVPFLLVHGLASNSRTWDLVAPELAEAGHRVVAVDLRGHGLSDKPEEGYDFPTITADLAGLIDGLKLDRALAVGQSWGGNVVLALGAWHPGLTRGLVLVDGGTIDFQAEPGNDWKRIAGELRPPDLTGTPRHMIESLLRRAHPDWTDAGIEATLANFETLPDSTVRPWLTLDRHMRILRALWEQRPGDLYPLVREPVLICLADTGNTAWTKQKKAQAAAAMASLRLAEEHWFPRTDHDIQIHRPQALARLMLDLASRA